VHKRTTKIEPHHKFAKQLAFGGHCLFRTNDPADREKGIVYDELVANAVVLQTVVDQTHGSACLEIARSAHRHRRLGVPQPLSDEQTQAIWRLPAQPGTGVYAVNTAVPVQDLAAMTGVNRNLTGRAQSPYYQPIRIMRPTIPDSAAPRWVLRAGGPQRPGAVR
jgi:hypothetical protein